jgi:hypothetical protein
MVTQATQTPAGTQYTQKSTMAGTKKAANWVSSKSKKLMRKDVIEERVTIEMNPLYVYGMREEYMESEFKNFNTNFPNLHAVIKREQDRAHQDGHAHAHDLLLHPPILQGPNGCPQW